MVKFSPNVLKVEAGDAVFYIDSEEVRGHTSFLFTYCSNVNDLYEDGEAHWFHGMIKNGVVTDRSMIHDYTSSIDMSWTKLAYFKEFVANARGRKDILDQQQPILPDPLEPKGVSCAPQLQDK